MQVMHLRYSPRIRMWRVGEQVTISWDNREHFWQDVPVWTASRGEQAVPVEVFMAEVWSFRERFVRATRARIEQIKQHWSRLEVKIDLAQLEEGQAEMVASTATYLSIGTTNWQDVGEAIGELRELLGRRRHQQ